MNKEDYQRQLIIANSLYEIGMNIDLIETITTVSFIDLNNYRKVAIKSSNGFTKKQ